MKRLRLLLALRDTVAGLILLGFCGVAWWLTTGFDKVPPMLSQNVPPTFFPRLVIFTAALLGAGLALDEIRRFVRGATGPATGRDEANAIDDARPVRIALPPPVFWATVGLIAAAGVSMPLLGTLPTLAIIAVALPLAWGERRLRVVAGLAAGLPAGIYLVFALGLGLRFPSGSVWNLLLTG